MYSKEWTSHRERSGLCPNEYKLQWRLLRSGPSVLQSHTFLTKLRTSSPTFPGTHHWLGAPGAVLSCLRSFCSTAKVNVTTISYLVLWLLSMTYLFNQRAPSFVLAGVSMLVWLLLLFCLLDSLQVQVHAWDVPGFFTCWAQPLCLLSHGSALPEITGMLGLMM
jgi:hypothetical protein